MEKISVEENKGILDNCFDDFINDTEEPRAYVVNGAGAFMAVGKLKEPTDHFGKPVNVVTIRIGQMRDNKSAKVTRTDVRFDELKILRNGCSKVIKEWK